LYLIVSDLNRVALSQLRLLASPLYELPGALHGLYSPKLKRFFDDETNRAPLTGSRLLQGLMHLIVKRNGESAHVFGS
jgi:hypothetical protein